MAKYLVLLGTPRDLNIPYFAMGAPSSRETSVVRLGIRWPRKASRSPVCRLGQVSKRPGQNGIGRNKELHTPQDGILRDMAGV